MDSRVAAVLIPPVYEDFEASSELVQEKDCDTILLNLPGFKKDHLKVQLTSSKVLRVAGSRPTEENKWRRFHKEFPVTPNHDTQKISAKFEGGTLYIRIPKIDPPVEKKNGKQDTKLPATDPAATQPPQKPAADQPPPQKSSVQEQAAEKPAWTDDSTKQTNGQNVKEDPKVAKEKKVEPTDSEKKAKKSPEEIASGLDEIKKKSISGDKRDDDKAKKYPEEKPSGLDDSKNKSTADDKRKDDSMKATEKREKGSSEAVYGSGKTRAQNYKETAADVASTLNKHRRLFNVTLVVIFAVALGLYITNFVKSLKRSEN